MVKIDYHIHSEYSSDSNAIMTEIVTKAISKGYSQIAFSDHFDLMPAEIAVYGVPSYRDFSNAIECVRVKYPQIEILKGVELGEYHRCHKTVDDILIMSPPDIKIGAIHVLPSQEQGVSLYRGVRNISIPLSDEPNKRLIRDYYLENLELVRYGNFDILAHLGVYKRYLKTAPDESFVDDIKDDILAIIIDSKIALEVNYSGLRKNIKSVIPDIDCLLKYKVMGGELITIASDAHDLEHFDSYYDKTASLLKDIGFKYIVRKNSNGWDKVKLKG